MTVDNNLESTYESAFLKMEPSYQEKVKELEIKDSLFGFSIFTTYLIDTLNKEDIIYHEGTINIEYRNSNSDTSEIAERKVEESTLIPVFTTAELINDTLNLSVGIPFYPIIRHKVFRNQEISVYEEYFKYDSILRLNLKDSKVSQLYIPIKIKKFLVNSSSFIPGQIIYGQVEFETIPYYSDDSWFKNNFIKKRLRATYLFKVRVNKNSI